LTSQGDNGQHPDMDYDIRIIGGTIIDGTGAAARPGDVAINDGRIVAVGNAPGDARETIDATGRVVAPGFIDLHTHYDAQVMWDPMLTVSPWHGVTTAVLGNCGFGIAPARPDHRDLMIRTLERVEGMSADALAAGLGDWPFETFPEYLAAIENRGVSINVAALLGHTPLRLYVMGRDAVEREATGDEVAAMRAILAEALEAGAIGFSSSTSDLHHGFDGLPVPSRLAAFDETLSFAGAMRDAGAGIFQTATGRYPDHDRLSAIAEATGRPVTWTALLTRGDEGRQYIEGHLARTAEQHARGLAIHPQVSCRPLTMEMRFSQPFAIERLPSFDAIRAADFDGKKRIYADPGFRAEMKFELDPDADRERAGFQVRGSWRHAEIAWCESHPELEGRNLRAAAADLGVDPIDLALDLSLESDLEARFRIPLANAEEDEIADLLADPNTVLGLSDAGAHASQLCDACFSTHLLGHWVRDKGALSLEAAVHRLTGNAAEIFGITDRGRLVEGLAADVVVFDPDTVGAGPLERVHDFPAGADRLVSQARGVDAVIVNGELLRRDGVDRITRSDQMPGKVLRSGRAA